MDNTDVVNIIIVAYRISFIVGLLSLVVAKWFLPDFLKYGKTFTVNTNEKNANSVKMTQLKQFLKYIEHITVPKQWFYHFYLLSTVFSIMTLVKNHNHKIIWLVLVHSIRRLYETLFVSKYTVNSRMNWSHYAVGLWFYSVLHLILNIKLLQNEISPKINTISLLIFVTASLDQYKNHKILSELVKYSLPKERLFNICSSPHYLDEILIYASFVSYSTEFSWLVLWIIASLTISATETHKYYKTKFKDETIPKYCIIPFII